MLIFKCHCFNNNKYGTKENTHNEQHIKRDTLLNKCTFFDDQQSKYELHRIPNTRDG